MTFTSLRRVHKRRMPLLAAAALAAVTARVVLADPPPARETTVPIPGRPLASNDQATAIGQNPANLAFLPSSEARWTWVRTGVESTDPARGHAFDVGFVLPFHLATGAQLDFVRPQLFAPQPFGGTPYAWFTWALAWRSNDAFSLGLSVQHAYSDAPSLDGLTSFTLAASARPSPYFALSVVGRDLNAPTTPWLSHIDRSVDVGVAVRPTGRRDFEIGLEDQYLDDSGQWLPRGSVGIDVPYVGRVRGDVTVSDPTTKGKVVYTASAGLELAWGSTTAEGGGVFGTALGGKGGAGFYSGLSISGYRTPGLPEPSYALKIRIEETPGARGHTRLLRRLWALAADPQLRAVAFVLKAEPVDSAAHGEELGDAIRLLRANGKKVICHMEDAGGRSLFACSQADRIVINPAGGIRFAGLKAQYQYFAGLLDKLGVRAQFVRVGAHKTAPEQFMREGATDVARADHIDLLHEFDSVFLSDIGGGRRIPTNRLQEIFATGPFIAAEAKHDGLVDGLAFDDEVGNVVDEVVGTHVRLIDEPLTPAAPRRFGARRKIAMVYVEGDMVDGRSKEVPLLGTHLVGSYTVVDAIKEAREDPLVGAVVLRVESPGGSSMAADVIWRELVLLAKKKPLIVSMGSTAASGGYYVAAPGQVIYANPLTVTGSIGIFYGKADVSELMKKIGVNVETYKTTPRADAESIYRPFTEEELAELQVKVHQFYDVFVDRVATGRHMTKADVDAVGQGRVWSGRQALARHLVDRLGGLRDAIAEARRLADLPTDAPIEELPVPETSLLGLAMKLAGASESPASAASQVLPPQLLELVRGLAPFTIYGAYEPLARMELFSAEPP